MWLCCGGCPHIDRRPRGSTHHHDASNLAMTTITKHSSSSAALRGNQRLRASALPKPPKRTPPGRSRRPPAAVLGARTSCGGQSISICSSREAAEQVYSTTAVQHRSSQTRLRALPRAIDELYISHGVHRRDARVGRVPSGAGRRPLPQLSALTAAPEPLPHALSPRDARDLELGILATHRARNQPKPCSVRDRRTSSVWVGSFLVKIGSIYLYVLYTTRTRAAPPSSS
jgi:hypothetical protein